MASDTDRGATAREPSDIPAKGFKEVALRVKDEIKQDNIPLLAGGVTFYAMLALFPAIVAAITLWGLVADAATIQQQVASLASGLPSGAADILQSQAESLTSASTGALGWGLAAGLAGALWTASSGTKGLMQALTVVYDEDETRGFLEMRGKALALTLATLVFAVVLVGLIAVIPAVLGSLGLGTVGETLVQWGRWPLIALAMAGALAVAYRYAPDRDGAEWRWVTPGSVTAAVVWLLASAGFSFYVSSFGSYSQTYGSLAGVIVLMMWLFLSAFAVLLGGEINAELEHQTSRDTTKGEPEPMGDRDAFVADTVAAGEDEPVEQRDRELEHAGR